jgi:hypothetical protein
MMRKPIVTIKYYNDRIVRAATDGRADILEHAAPFIIFDECNFMRDCVARDIIINQ